MPLPRRVKVGDDYTLPRIELHQADYQTLMLPLLQYLADGQQKKVKEIVEHLANEFQLTPEERMQTIPSGYKPLFY